MTLRFILTAAAVFACAGCRTTSAASRVSGSPATCETVAGQAAARKIDVETQGVSGAAVAQHVTVGESTACVLLKDEEASYAVDVPIAKSDDGTCRVSGALKDRQTASCT